MVIFLIEQYDDTHQNYYTITLNGFKPTLNMKFIDQNSQQNSKPTLVGVDVNNLKEIR